MSKPQKFETKKPHFVSPIQKFIAANCSQCPAYGMTCGIHTQAGIQGMTHMQACIDAALLAAFNEPAPTPEQVLSEAAASVAQLMDSDPRLKALAAQLGDGVEVHAEPDQCAPDEHPTPHGLGVKKA
jgi:hypothetical protein